MSPKPDKKRMTKTNFCCDGIAQLFWTIIMILIMGIVSVLILSFIVI